MSAVTATELSHPFGLTGGGFLSPPWEDRTARVASRRLKSSVAVISAHGAIDASNAGTLTEYTLRYVPGCRGLILDLSGLDFFGTEGFSALRTVSACCADAGTSWAVVPGWAVSRLLRICVPNAWLPAADTIESALATFGDQPHRPPQLIASRPNPGQSSRCERTVCVVCGGINTSATNSGRPSTTPATTAAQSTR
jgi:anti-anti-sigma factor